MPELTTEQEDRIKLAVDEALKKAGLNEIPNKFTPGGEPENKTEPEVKFKDFGEFLGAVAKATIGGGVDARLKAPSGLNEATPSEGGFLVEQQFVDELLKRTYETGVLVNKCRKIPIGPGFNGLKINAIDETSRATGSRWGGVRAYWLNEAGEKTSSKPKFRRMSMDLEKLIGLCYATDELLQDYTALGSLIGQAFAEEFGFLIDDALINGTGVGQPLGILNANCLVSVPKETGQSATTIVAANIMKMWSRMWAKSRPNAVWYINQDCEPELHNMSLSVGTGGIPVYMPPNGLAGQPYSTLYGRPVIPIEHCQTLGTVGDIILADFSQYLLIDKGGIQANESIHVRFVYDETAFRFVYRLNGQPIWNDTLTPYKGSSTLSPFVALATRS